MIERLLRLLVFTVFAFDEEQKRIQYIENKLEIIVLSKILEHSQILSEIIPAFDLYSLNRVL